MKKAFTLAITALVFTACTMNNRTSEITIEDKYGISLPASLSKTDNLNEDASLQYQNIFKEFYVIVIDEPKSELGKALEENELSEYYENNIDGYSDLILEGMEQTLSNVRKEPILDTTIHHLSAKLLSLTADVDGISAYYNLGFFEGEENYYQILAWTLAEKKEDHEAKMNAIMRTFHELDQEK